MQSQKIKTIYNRFMNDLSLKIRPVDYYTPNKWKGVHNPILPKYLKTFTYKLLQIVLVFQIKFSNVAFDNPKLFCCFCNRGSDSTMRVFIACNIFMPVLEFC